MKNNQTLPKSGFLFTCGSEDPHPVRDEILVETHAFPLPSARFCVVATQNLAGKRGNTCISTNISSLTG